MSAWERLDTIFQRESAKGHDMEIKLEFGTDCAWSGELRFTPEPGRVNRPDVSTVLFTCGSNPEEVTQRLLNEFEIQQSRLKMSPNREDFSQMSKGARGDVVIRRRRMTLKQYEQLRRAARKMVQDVRKYIKRKRL